MTRINPAPKALKLVAWVFIISGLASLIDVIVLAFEAYFRLELGVLGLLIGPGLLRLRPGWRVSALVYLWFGIVLAPLLAYLILTGQDNLSFRFFGVAERLVSKVGAVAMTAAMLALFAWQLRVLCRAEVRAQFRDDG